MKWRAPGTGPNAVLGGRGGVLRDETWLSIRAVRQLWHDIRDARLTVEETRMSESMKLMRPIAGAALALWGLASPAWATYGGGACTTCAPAPVVQTQCNVVTLAPQYQTVMQTVY